MEWFDHLLHVARQARAQLRLMRVLALLAGLLGLVATILLPAPAGLSTEAWRTAGLAGMMGL